MGAKVLEKINSYNKEYGDFRYKQAILLMTDAMVFMGAFIISLLVTLGIIYFNNLLFLTMVIISLITFMIIGDYKTLWSTSVDKEVITIFISTVFFTTSILVIFPSSLSLAVTPVNGSNLSPTFITLSVAFITGGSFTVIYTCGYMFHSYSL